MNYKALTLTQPWATLVAIGAKSIETRSWATSYRGPLAIHAAATYGKGGARVHKELCGEEPFCSVLNAACERHYERWRWLSEMAEHPFMPMGAIVAVCDLVDCAPIHQDSTGWGFISAERKRHQEWLLTDQERAFGDYTPGRFAWLLANVRPLARPLAAKGALGLWHWEGAL